MRRIFPLNGAGIGKALFTLFACVVPIVAGLLIKSPAAFAGTGSVQFAGVVQPGDQRGVPTALIRTFSNQAAHSVLLHNKTNRSARFRIAVQTTKGGAARYTSVFRLRAGRHHRQVVTFQTPNKYSSHARLCIERETAAGRWRRQSCEMVTVHRMD